MGLSPDDIRQSVFHRGGDFGVGAVGTTNGGKTGDGAGFAATSVVLGSTYSRSRQPPVKIASAKTARIRPS
jgi:hypothetical protein